MRSNLIAGIRVDPSRGLGPRALIPLAPIFKRTELCLLRYYPADGAGDDGALQGPRGSHLPAAGQGTRTWDSGHRT